MQLNTQPVRERVAGAITYVIAPGVKLVAADIALR